MFFSKRQQRCFFHDGRSLRDVFLWDVFFSKRKFYLPSTSIFGFHVDFPGCFLPTSWCFRLRSWDFGRKREELTWKHHSIHAMVEHITKSKRLQPLTVENRWRSSKIPSWETCLKRRFRMEGGTTKIHHPAPVSWKAKWCDHWNQHFPRSGWSKATNIHVHWQEAPHPNPTTTYQCTDTTKNASLLRVTWAAGSHAWLGAWTVLKLWIQATRLDVQCKQEASHSEYVWRLAGKKKKQPG